MNLKTHQPQLPSRTKPNTKDKMLEKEFKLNRTKTTKTKEKAVQIKVKKV